MTVETSDIRSNPNEQIIHAAEIIGNSLIRQKVFEEIHRGKIRIKTVSEIMEKTGLNRTQVLQAGIYLYNNRIIEKSNKNGEMAYERDDFFFQNKNKILKLAKDKKARNKYPTKRNPQINLDIKEVKLKINIKYSDIKKITLDDINSFSKINDIKLPENEINEPIDEKWFKKGLQNILHEEGVFIDWGGETDDLYTNKIEIEGRRIYAAFGLKGKGKQGKLTPNKMGKQGDQIQRLFRAPADAFLVQYWGQISESIIEQMQSFAYTKSALNGNRVYYGIIDGYDTRRLIKAYPEAFK